MNKSYQPTTKRVPCGTAIIIWLDKSKRSLLTINRIGAHGAGKISVPGGWVDPGEDPAEAIIRETWEEVGLTVTDLKFRGYTYDLHPEGVEDVCLWFEATDWLGHARSTDPDRISRVSWMPLVEFIGLPEHKMFCPVQNLIKKGIIGELLVQA